MTEELSKFPASYIKENPRAALDDELKEKLHREFENLKASVSGIHKHLVNKVHITLKKLEKITAARNSDRVIALRKAIIEQYIGNTELDFAKHCVLLMKLVSVHILKVTMVVHTKAIPQKVLYLPERVLILQL